MKRNPQPDLSLVSQIDWARLAAYIDGEGNVCIASQVHKPPFEGRGRYGYLRVTVSNTDFRLAEWLTRNFGGNLQIRRTHSEATGRQQRWKPCFNWSVSNQRAAEVLATCMEYFIIKREQAEIGIAYQSTMCRSGRKGTPDSVLSHRSELKTKLMAMTSRGPRAANE